MGLKTLKSYDTLARRIVRNRILLDPGFGFGKTLDHNLTLLQHIGSMQTALNVPLLAGLSRKSMIGQITGRPIEQRMAGSLAAALLAAQQGAKIVRVHDVAETVDALKMWHASTQTNCKNENP